MKGSALVQVLVFIMILALLSAMTLQMLLAQATLAARGLSTLQNQALAEGANNQLNGCLSNITQGLCNSTTIAACGFPMTMAVEGQCRTITADPLWISGSCQVAIHVSAC